ncbi:hypothetical protein GN157_17300 [Flavobacterium rakeshii]|uniref:DUF4369 domain-containing protein n=1 Tax=Flavobacterium rakeshii TaxID=1038845 RepID=A0A6N8HIH7_9FLAO|nr:hypothetical protein [Flavobacterium rakeshii]MUV05473.1 hypothetical protein [Flavobacterium rakeshii]
MKKILTIFCLVLSVSAFSQMKVTKNKESKVEVIGAAKPMGVLFGQINKTDDGTCSFIYRDTEYTQTDKYELFYFNYSDLDTLYGLFTDFSNVKEGDSFTVDILKGEKLIFEYKKMLGKIYPYVTHVGSAYEKVLPYYTPKQLKKIFGKKK